MGLDSVELVLAVEERFGVNITDAEAQACTTPGTLVEIISAKLELSNERICLAQRAFHLLRKSAMEILDVPRKSVVLEADVRALTNGKLESKIWAALESSLQARSWPTLTIWKRIPGRAATFRALVPFAMTSAFISWHRDQVAQIIRDLVIKQLGLKETEYREDANFVTDLGLS
jgi:acyl carrier protein